MKNIVELVYDFIRGLEMRKLNYQIEKTKLFSSKYKIALLGVLGYGSHRSQLHSNNMAGKGGSLHLSSQNVPLNLPYY